MNRLSIREFCNKYPTWEQFMAAVTGPIAGSNIVAKELGELIGEDLGGVVSQVRTGANASNGGVLVSVNIDNLTNKYYAIRRASHS